MNRRYSFLLAASALLSVLPVPALSEDVVQHPKSAIIGAQSSFGSPLSDLIAGYVIDFNKDTGAFRLRTSGQHEITIQLGSFVYGEMVRNLGEKFSSPEMNWSEALVPGRYAYVYGVAYPNADKSGAQLEAKRIVFPSHADGDFVFDQADWWPKQVSELADFYLKAQFDDGEIDYRNYRTNLSLEGQKLGDGIQEAATISRLVYGFASAYMMTGNDKYREAAEKGTRYLHDNFRVEKDGEIHWLHALNIHQDGTVEKITASHFADDLDAIPLYEQIYDLAGPVQTYRITGSPEILDDVDRTLAFFQSRYRDNSEAGGYYSHIDPVTFAPNAESLGDNRSKKNWNSIGDHAPAYLINLWLATGANSYSDLLEDTFDTIAKRFPATDGSPFVNERFFADWQTDRSYKWQQDQAVVGHDLKIAWNLTRMNNLVPKESYTILAKALATSMPAVGADLQRGGWYDVVERQTHDGETIHRFAFHDRKAWWQQEQAILAYLIMAGTTDDETYARLAREALSFYNAWFLDHEDGGVYFNVLASGLPYLNGVERQKGSHSMSGYHAFELAFLSNVYGKLLLRKEPLDLYFRPAKDGFVDNILRVQPDILPPGKVKISEVWIDGISYTDFDADALTVALPPNHENPKVKVRLVAG